MLLKENNKHIDIVIKEVLSGKIGRAGSKRYKFALQNALLECCIHLSMDHKNIIKCYGYAFEEPSPFPKIILEYCKDGSLSSILSSQIAHEIDAFSLEKKINIFHQIAKGMKYLHSIGYVHHDLKLENVVMNGNDIKIIDFGLTRVVNDVITTGVITMKSQFYCAPEIHKKMKKFQKMKKNAIEEIQQQFRDIYTVKCDVYAFGMIIYFLLFEIYVNGSRIGNEKNIETLIYYSSDIDESLSDPNFEPKLPKRAKSLLEDDKEGKVKKLIELMKKCYNNDPNERPSFEDICENLKKLYEFSFCNLPILHITNNNLHRTS